MDQWSSVSAKAPERWAPTEQVQRLLSEANVEAVAANGNIDIALHVTGDGARTPATVSGSSRVTRSIVDGVLLLAEDVAPDSEPQPSARPSVSVEVASLARVIVQSGATVVLSGTLDELSIEAFNYGTIDATALALRSATVDLEKSAVSMYVTEKVTGHVAYLSELTVTGGGDVSHISTRNAGRVITGPAGSPDTRE